MSQGTKPTPWGVHSIGSIIAPQHTSVQLKDGTWGRCVPEPYTANSIRAAWEVLCGRAHAIKWPTHEELNEALRRGDYPRS